MGLEQVGYVELPPHAGTGGFDHAAVHRRSRRIYVAHTANDAIDVIDGETRRHVGSIGGVTGVAGALVSDEHDLVFTSNRGENTVGIVSPSDGRVVAKIEAGHRPNGLAYDPVRRRLIAANVGDPAVPGSFTVSAIDIGAQKRLAEIPVPGRTRWTVYDASAGVFHVNIADPPLIAVIDSREPLGVSRVVTVPSAGPHGLDLDLVGRRLFCACDGGQLVEIDADSGAVLRRVELGGVPDVIFFHPTLKRLYVAVGDPGVIEVYDTATMRRVEIVTTERGAHTLALDADADTVWAFLPETHRAAVYADRG